MSYASVVLADGAVGYWRLGEASAVPAVDQAGNSNGTYQNTAAITFGQTGIPGGGGGTACKFTPGTGQVQIPDVAAQHVGDVFTLEAWAKIGALTGGPYTILCSNNSTGPNMEMDVSSGTAGVVLQKAGVSEITRSSLTLISDTTTFHHCVWTKNAATTVLYIDGAVVTGSVANATISNSNVWYIAQNTPSGSHNYFSGTLAEVAIYPTALTATKVTNHYHLGAAINPANTVAPVASGSTTVGSVVSTTNGTWADAGSPTFTYQWQRDVLGNGTYSNIAAATSSSYTLVLLDDACDVRCVVTDTDAIGATSANSNSILDTTPVSGTTADTSFSSNSWTLWG